MTVQIHGKNYIEVKDRVAEFRANQSHKDFGIETSILFHKEGEVVIQATIKDLSGRIIAQGLAHELQSNGKINKTSYIENGETSAIGRALACLGYGVDTSYASANEVVNAIAQQNEPSKVAKTKDIFTEAQTLELIEKLSEVDTEAKLSACRNIISACRDKYIIPEIFFQRILDAGVRAKENLKGSAEV